MTGTSNLLIALAVVMSAVDWMAVARGNSVLEYMAKPAATIAFLASAATLDVAHGASWAWLLAALVFCLLGDVFLMLPRDAFVPGLASFAVAQIFFTVGFLSGDAALAGLIAGLVVVVPVGALLARRYVGAIGRTGQGQLVVPVVAYMVVISAMAVASFADGNPVSIAGAAIFMLSDSLIAESRFVRARAWHPVGIMVTYHVALAGLVLGLL